MSKEIIETKETSNFLLYTGNDGDVKVDVFLEDETVWLTQKAMGMFFGKSKKTISEHLTNIFKAGELDKIVVVRKYRTTTQHGVIEEKTQTKNVQYYNLDAIISVGYRVNSLRATQFQKEHYANGVNHISLGQRPRFNAIHIQHAESVQQMKIGA